MDIKKISISNDPAIYEAWPDVVLATDGRLLCVFSECIHHNDRSYTRIMQTESFDRGRTWTAKHPITEGTEGLAYYYNCARISRLKDGRLALVVDKIPSSGEGNAEQSRVVVRYSNDNGISYSEPETLPICGIVPDKICQLDTGRMISSAHRPYRGRLTQFLRYSDDHGVSWSDDIMLAHDPSYDLCEASILPVGNGALVAFLRENTCIGLDCFKTISYDNGETWGPLLKFPIPGCHRPVSGFLKNGKILITYRFIQGGSRGKGSIAQNFFAAITDKDSALAVRRNDASTRLFPVDYDASPKPDLGYSGWAQFEDGEVYIVNYIVDDAFDKGQIRGYSLHPDEIILAQRTDAGEQTDGVLQ